MIEIERKFLVKNTSFLDGCSGLNIKQGYLSTDPERTVRIRQYGDTGFLTIKGASNKSGMSRSEWEKELLLSDLEELWPLCLESIIHKTRYRLNHDAMIWEVDIFHDDNNGLILAEVELESENQSIELPDWIKEEVTGDKKYYNSYLSKLPFKKW
ncbi:MAG: CYTH domain-containing protein [Nonlabens sp.]